MRRRNSRLHSDSTLPNPLDSPLIKNLLLGISNVKRAAQDPAAPKDTALTFGTVLLLEQSNAYKNNARDVMLFAAVAFGVAARRTAPPDPCRPTCTATHSHSTGTRSGIMTHNDERNSNGRTIRPREAS